MGILDSDHFQSIRKAHADYVTSRREVIKLSGDAQSASKRAIFALHRDDMKGADGLLKKAEDGFAEVRKLIDKQPELAHEGSYRAGIEEYVEAVLYREFVKRGDVGPVALEGVTYEIYLAGLSDLTGELQRRQVRLATEGDVEGVKAIKDAVTAIVEELVSYDFGGYLRTKFDQAKNSLRRAEDVVYDVSLRRE
ncbi:hypothetical protein ACFLZO_00430 [Patescibacteria group bacterium]